MDRVWNMFQKHGTMNNDQGTENKEVTLAIHKAIKNVGTAIKSHRFNVGVAELMKCLNEIENCSLLTAHCSIFMKLLAPYAPHMAEELWMEVLGNKISVHLERWPEVDENLLAEELVTLVVQVNGKFRDSIKMKRGLPEEDVKKMVLENKKIQKEIIGKEIKKFIYIQDKLTNIVV